MTVRLPLILPLLFACGLRLAPTAEATVGLAAARAAARTDGALILACFTRSDHRICRRLQERVLPDPAVAEALGEAHVVWLDVEAEPDLARDYAVRAVPTVLLMTPAGKIVARRRGVTTAELFALWLAEARERLADGLWQGVADAETTAATDPAALVQALEARAPVARQRMRHRLRRHGATAMPALLAALTDPYLGIRVEAARVLHQLAPDAPAYDPWAGRAERAERTAALTAWWEETGSLAETAPPTLDERGRERLTTHLRQLADGDPPRRTAALTAIALCGRAALPAIREHRAAAHATGDQELLGLLDDLRWYLLVPDAMAEAGSLRRALAHGTSAERQQACTGLSTAGKTALPALRELLHDEDRHVRECAVEALRNIGGSQAVTAMAELLASDDSNLRMVTAQALGLARRAGAATHLARAVADPDEAVACTAIDAIERLRATDQRETLESCLKDQRWRVRAAAAKTIGELELKVSIPALHDLLADEDGFVVKTALEALQKLKAKPPTDRLLALAERLPDLTRLVVSYLIEHDSAATVETLVALYQRPGTPKGALLGGLLQSGYRIRRGAQVHWRPLFDLVLAEKDAQLRTQLIPALLCRSARLSRYYLDQLLADPDPSVRTEAARLVLRVAAVHWGLTRDDDEMEHGSMPGSGGKNAEGAERTAAVRQTLAGLDLSDLDPAQRTTLLEQLGEQEDTGTNGAATVRGRSIAEQHAVWHELLAAHLRARPDDLAAALAWYATGDGRTGLDELESLLCEQGQIDRLAEGDFSSKTIGLLLKRLPWPEGRPLLEVLAAEPAHHGMLLQALEAAGPQVRAHLMDPDRLLPAIVGIEDGDLTPFIRVLLTDHNKPFSLLRTDDATNALRRRLLAHESGRLRTLGIFAAGFGTSGKDREDILQGALDDPDPWVRYAAIQGLIRTGHSGPDNELLAELVKDPEPPIAMIATAGLLLPKLRSEGHFSGLIRRFHYEDYDTWVSVGHSYRSNQDKRLLRPLPGRPAYLATCKARLDQETWQENRDWRRATALLLAQYGDPSGLHRELERWRQDKSRDDLLMLGLPLTGDPVFAEVIASRLETTSSYYLREMLGLLVGHDSPTVRRLRRTINRRLRQEGN